MEERKEEEVQLVLPPSKQQSTIDCISVLADSSSEYRPDYSVCLVCHCLMTQELDTSAIGANVYSYNEAIIIIIRIDVFTH